MAAIMRWYTAFVGLLIAVVALAAYRHQRLRVEDPAVAIVSIVGPTAVAAPSLTRFDILVRDRDGVAIADAKVRVGFERNGFDEAASATTSAAGDALVEVPIGPIPAGEGRLLRVHVDSSLGHAQTDRWLFPRANTYGFVTVTTDKASYEPGDVVHIRGVLGHEGRTAISRPVSVIVERDSVVLMRHADKLTGYGTVAVDYPLSSRVGSGRYRVRVSVPPLDGDPLTEAAGQADIEVRHRGFEQRDSSRVLVTVGDFDVRQGGTVEGNVRAIGRSGAPVSGWPVRVVVVDAAGALDEIARGKLDKNGLFRFVLAPNARYHTFVGRQIKAVVGEGSTTDSELTKIATRSLSRRERFHWPLRLTAYPEGGQLVAGAKQTVYFVVAGGDGARTLRVLDQEVPVPESGIVRLDLAVPTTDFAARVEGSADPAGRPAELAEESLRPRADALSIHTERDVFAVEAKAHVTVFGASDGDQVVLQVMQGTDVVARESAKVRRAADGASMVVDLHKELAGFVWLRATSAPAGKDGTTRSGRRLVQVVPPKRDLKIKLTPDRPEHEPRSTGSVDVEVTDEKGAPVKTELGVLVTDLDVTQVWGDVRAAGCGRQVFERTARELAAAVGHVDTEDISAIVALASPESSDELRGVTLATIAHDHSGMPTELSSMGNVAEREDSITRSRHSEERRTRAWVIVTLAILAVALLLPFLRIGFEEQSRGRRPPIALPKEERTRVWLQYIRASSAFTTAMVLPPVAALGCELVVKSFTATVPAPVLVAAIWAALAIVTALTAAHFLHRLEVSRWTRWMAGGLLAGHGAAILGHLDGGVALARLFYIASDRHLVVTVLVIAGQLVLVMLAILRLTRTEPTTLRDRRARLVKSAFVTALPLTLGLFLYGSYLHVRAANVTWRELAKQEAVDELLERRGCDLTLEESRAKEGASVVRNRPGDYEPDRRVHPDRELPDVMPAVTAAYRAGHETRLATPAIVTDEKGRARVPVEFAGALGSYRLHVEATGRAGERGAASLELVVKPKLTVVASVPKRLTQGDSIELPVWLHAGPSGDDVMLTVSGDGFGSTTRRVKVGAGASIVEVFPIRAGVSGPRFVRVEAVGLANRDAFETPVTVVPNGSPFTRTVFDRDHTFTVSPETVEGGNDLWVELSTSTVGRLANEIDGEAFRSRGGIEPTLSAMYPGLLALDVLATTKSTSPEIERRARASLALGLQELAPLELPGGQGWSLVGEPPASPVLTAYALMTFRSVEKATDASTPLAKRAALRLVAMRRADGSWSDSFAESAFIAWALAGETAGADALDFISGKRATVKDPYELALAANALLAGRRDALPWIEALIEAKALHGDEEPTFWTSPGTSVFGAAGDARSVETTALAAHAIAVHGLKNEEAVKARDWLAKQRAEDGTWGTTAATAAALRAFADDPGALDQPADVLVRVDGDIVERLRIEPKDRDLVRRVDLRRYATRGEHTVNVQTPQPAVVARISARSTLPHGKRATPSTSPLHLDVDYPSEPLRLGDIVTVRVRLEGKGPGRTVMSRIAVPVPPCFEADPERIDALAIQGSSRAPRTPGAVHHASVDDGRVVLFVEPLEAGQHAEIELSFLTTCAGKVTVHHATAAPWSDLGHAATSSSRAFVTIQ